MITEDELKKYLPKYLSEENYKTLLAELKSFPYNIDGRMYTSMLTWNKSCMLMQVEAVFVRKV